MDPVLKKPLQENSRSTFSLKILAKLKGVSDPGQSILTRDQLAFRRFLVERDGEVDRDLSGLGVFSTPDLVSIILPVYNGENYIEKSVRSVFQQTYPHFELIVVDDGSTDATPEILGQLAGEDPRLRIHRQPNRKLPAALNTGHEKALGEFLTWTSDDNLMKPDFLEQMVKTLQGQPAVDMIYADYELIDAEGNPAHNVPFCAEVQNPPGSGKLVLPADTSILMFNPGNYIGGAFLYRRRVIDLIGTYHEEWLTCEDYDFFLRANCCLTLRKADLPEPLYQYRIHSDSISAAADMGRRDRMADACRAFDYHRRDLLIAPVGLTCEYDTAGNSGIMKGVREELTRIASSRTPPGSDDPEHTIYLRISDRADAASQPPPTSGLQHCMRVMWCIKQPGPCPPEPGWDILVTSAACEIDRECPEPLQGWWYCTDPATLYQALKIRLCTKLSRNDQPDTQSSRYALSVIICTNRPGQDMKPVLDALAEQQVDDDWEVILVDNAPDARGSNEWNDLKSIWPGSVPLRVVSCPVPGLSRARNAGLGHARGDLVLYLDDDALPCAGLLEAHLSTYRDHPEAGACGGTIETEPERHPVWWGPSIAAFFSDFRPEEKDCHEVKYWEALPYGANWSARRSALLKIGGFAERYGRGGRITQSGEDLVAGLMLQLAGFKVIIQPAARVRHCIHADRLRRRKLFQMVIDSYRTRFQLENDNLIPRDLHILNMLTHPLHRMCRVISPRISRAQRLEHLLQASACIYLFLKMARDLFLRIVLNPVR
jgi:glycosyltransferase involved in cell wall biosynthesis